MVSPYDMTSRPSSARAWVARAARPFVLVAATFAYLACGSGDNLRPPDPASVASLSIAPSAIPIVKGASHALAVTALDSAGKPVSVRATWESTAPLVATVSKDGVVSAVGFGLAAITATVGTRTATAEVLVTAEPIVRAYSVTDLGSALPVGGMTRQLSDSGDVLAGGELHRGGIATVLSGCTTPVTINGPGHVLCRLDVLDSISSYGIWHDGTLTPLAAADSFKAEHFRAFAMDDADEVAGLVYNPAFSNANCATAGARCLSIWKDGSVTFPGFNAPAELMLMNNTLQVVLQDPVYAEYHTSPAVIYDVATGKDRLTPWGIRSLNDKGWAAIAKNYILRVPGEGSRLASIALIATPSSVVVLGGGSASGINNDNVVVGTLDFGPFIWSGDGGVSLLGQAATDPSWTITVADEINDRGQILAIADNSDGRKGHTVILTPTQP